MESFENPTARALRTLELLRHRPGITAGELAVRLGVTDRAARRGWRYTTHVVFDAPPDQVVPHVIPPMGTLSPLDDGLRTALQGTTDNPTMYAGEWLARIPIPFHIIDGPELRQAMAAVAERMTAATSRRRTPM